VSVERVPFRLADTLEEVIRLQAAAAESRGCALSLRWPQNERDGFLGDPGKIKIVVSNFVSNALKYAPGKPVTLGVEVMATEAREAGGAGDGMATVLIEVADQGPGIPAEELELIFRKFVRGSGAREMKVSGTGLGLATCRVLARLMNGNVGVESPGSAPRGNAKGGGATFYLRLLLLRAAVGQAPAALPEDSVLVPGTRALIVEDEDYNQAVLEGIALELGLVPECAANGAEAEAKFSERPYPIVFLDLELPGAKGGEVARHLRTKATGRRAIILATTAHDSDEIRAECRAAGMDGFLLKPFSAETVRQVLAEAEAKRDAEEFVVGPVVAAAAGVLEHEAFLHYARARPLEAAQAPGRYRRAIRTEAERLARGTADKDLGLVAAAAHRLRALGGLVGANELNRAAGKLEQLAKSGTSEEREAQAALVQSALRGPGRPHDRLRNQGTDFAGTFDCRTRVNPFSSA